MSNGESFQYGGMTAMKRYETNGSATDLLIEEALSMQGETETPLPKPRSWIQQERRSSRELLDGLPVIEVSDVSGDQQKIRFLRGILRTHHQQRQPPTARVCFSTIYVREYARTVGDHPSCSSGVPISLAWEHSETRALDLEEFESIRIANLRKRAHAAGVDDAMEKVVGVSVLAKEERERMLREEWGVTQAEMAAAVREGLRIKHSRKTNLRNQSSTAGKIVNAITKLTSEKGKEKQTKEEARLLAKAKAAEAARKKLLEQERQAQAKIKQLPSHRKPLSSYRLATFLEPQEEASELAAPETQHRPEPRRKQLVELNLVLERHRPGYHPKRSILKSSSKNNSNKHLQNSVSFAADPSTRKIWCMVREFTKVDVSWLDSIWLTEDEMEDRFERDMQICNLVRSQMAQMLRAAFKSTRVRAMSADNDYETIFCQDVELNFRHYRQCSIARGLEKEIVPEVHDLIIQSHRKVVLTKQHILGEMRAECGGIYVMEQDDWESIRKSCIKFSLPSRLLALKLGAFDQFSAMETTKSNNKEPTF